MLDLSQIIPYVVALAIAAAIPGPGMTALIARSVSNGAASGFAMLVGLIMADLTYLSLAVFGLAVIAANFSVLFIIIKWAAAAYLFYLAWVFWHAKHQAIDINQVPSSKDFVSAALSGYAITMGNPKTIGFYLALLPVVIKLDQISIQQWAMVLMPLTVAVLLFVGALFILAAIAIRKALSTHKAQKLLYRGASSAMILAAGMMVLKQ